MRYFCLFLLSMMLIVSQAQGQEAEDAFGVGNKEALLGHGKEALEAYEKLIRQGNRSPDLFYNAAHAAYQAGFWGKSLAYSQEALRRAPRATDIRANHQWLQDQRPGKEEISWARSFLKKTFFWVSYVRASEMLFLFGASSLFFWGFLLLHLLFERKGFKKAWELFLVLTVFLGLGWVAHRAFFFPKNEAFIAVPKAPVWFSFVEKTVIGELADGTCVRVVDEQAFAGSETLALIEFDGGKKGWVPLSALVGPSSLR